MPTARKKTVVPTIAYKLLERLKDSVEAAAYVEATIEEGDQSTLMMALCYVQAQGGISKLARKSKLMREATYRMLSATGNLGLRSLTAILDAGERDYR